MWSGRSEQPDNVHRSVRPLVPGGCVQQSGFLPLRSAWESWHGTPGSEAFCALAHLGWDSSGVCRESVEASPLSLPHLQDQAPPIGKAYLACIHVSTQVLQVPSHSPMVERGEVQCHLGWRGSDPPAQLEERQQAFPPARLIALPKIVITQPHPQIRYSDLQHGHDLVFGIIQFPHLAFTCLEIYSAFAELVGGLDRTVHRRLALVFQPRWWLRAKHADDALPTPPPGAEP